MAAWYQRIRSCSEGFWPKPPMSLPQKLIPERNILDLFYIIVSPSPDEKKRFS